MFSLTGIGRYWRNVQLSGKKKEVEWWRRGRGEAEVGKKSLLG